MTPGRFRPDRPPDGRAVASSTRLYGPLIRAYPKDLRDEHGEEMVRSFRDLCRAELRARGARGLASLWGRTLPELVLTTLKERSTMLARNAYLPVPPTAAARLGGISALVGGTVGMASYLIVVPAAPMPISFVVLLLCALLSSLALFGLYGRLAAPSSGPGRLAAAGAVFAVLSVGSWMAFGAFGALGLALDWAVGLAGVAALAGACCWFVGLLLLGAAVLRARVLRRLRTLPLAVAALLPVSVVLPAAFPSFGTTLVIGLPFLGSALLGWTLIKSGAADPLAVPGGATTSGDVGSDRRMTGDVPRSASEPRRRRTGTSAPEVAKEKELLEALRRRGELTVAGATLETSLSVEEAERMLSDLAVKGHLEVRAEHGRLHYSLWESDG